jgi:3-dehydrosphinganine reductase
MKLAGKNVYISGGSSGIGLAVGQLCAELGANVLIFARNEKKLEEAKSKIEQSCRISGQQVEAISVDVADNDQVAQKLGQAGTEFGAPYLLVNSAGLGGAYYFEKLPYERFDATMKINVYGLRNVIDALLPSMKEGGGGHIANVSSIGGFIGLFGYTAYSTSKFAVNGFSECLRSEMKRFNINVSVLCPPDVDTPMMQSETKSKPAETVAISSGGGLMQPEDVAVALLRGLDKKKALIIPGTSGKFFHLLNRLFPWLREWVLDRTIKMTQRQLAASGKK